MIVKNSPTPTLPQWGRELQSSRKIQTVAKSPMQCSCQVPKGEAAYSVLWHTLKAWVLFPCFQISPICLGSFSLRFQLTGKWYIFKLRIGMLMGIFASSSVYISQVDQCKKNILPEGVVEVRVDSKGRTPHLVCPVHPNTSTPLFSLVLLYVCQRKHRSLKIWPPEAISPAVTRPIAIFCRFA